MARNCIAAMDALGFSSFYACAHDRGARAAHKFCVDHPLRVRRVIPLDICPTLALYTKTDLEFAEAYFHWFFFIEKEPLPETLISAAPRRFAELFMGGRQPRGLEFFDQGSFDRYVQNLKDYETVHAMCQNYRASTTLDLDEARGDLKAERRIWCPLLVLWGKRGVIEKCFDTVQEWREVAGEGMPISGYAVESGHYIPEEAPDEILKAIKHFLDEEQLIDSLDRRPGHFYFSCYARLVSSVSTLVG